VNEETIEQLKLSRGIIGEVHAMVVDYDGEILSGQHRKKAGWEKVHNVDSREMAKKCGVTPQMAKHMLKLHLNIQRKPSREETSELLLKMALELEKQEIEEMKIASELAKRVPYSHQYVLQLLPDRYKQLEKAVSPGRPPSVKLVKQPETLLGLVECARCYMADRNCQEYGGEMLCPRCLELAKYKPEKAKVSPSTPEVTEYKAKEKWEYRKAVMMPQISKMEEAVLVKLEAKGLHPEVQKEFCLRSTRPDYYFPQQNLAIFLDGPVHKGREDRDEAIRELLIKRHGVQVVSISYEGTSQTTLDEIVRKIERALH